MRLFEFESEFGAQTVDRSYTGDFLAAENMAVINTPYTLRNELQQGTGPVTERLNLLSPKFRLMYNQASDDFRSVPYISFNGMSPMLTSLPLAEPLPHMQ